MARRLVADTGGRALGGAVVGAVATVCWSSAELGSVSKSPL
jgi:hypothetical protein